MHAAVAVCMLLFRMNASVTVCILLLLYEFCYYCMYAGVPVSMLLLLYVCGDISVMKSSCRKLWYVRLSWDIYRRMSDMFHTYINT